MISIIQTCQDWLHSRTLICAIPSTWEAFLETDWIAPANTWILSVTSSESPLVHAKFSPFLLISITVPCFIIFLAFIWNYSDIYISVLPFITLMIKWNEKFIFCFLLYFNNLELWMIRMIHICGTHIAVAQRKFSSMMWMLTPNEVLFLE